MVIVSYRITILLVIVMFLFFSIELPSGDETWQRWQWKSARSSGDRRFAGNRSKPQWLDAGDLELPPAMIARGYIPVFMNSEYPMTELWYPIKNPQWIPNEPLMNPNSTPVIPIFLWPGIPLVSVARSSPNYGGRCQRWRHAGVVLGP